YPGDKYFSREISRDERAIRLWLDRHIMPFTGTRFLKREFLLTNALMFSPRYTVLEDGEFAVRLYRKANTIAYINEYSYIYCQTRDPESSKRTAYRSFKSMTIRWDDFYHDIEYWDLSDECRKLVDKEKLSFIRESRERVIMALDHVSTKEEYMYIINMLNEYVGREIKQLPLPKGRDGIIFAVARIIGIPKTASLLYDYLHFRKIK
ncbi:MAG: hypothetical protein J6C76_02355, partial [Oscillospiraceae bacterium]|nr:hypothetical protein [Oscillospiraceae bacterium]